MEIIGGEYRERYSVMFQNIASLKKIHSVFYQERNEMNFVARNNSSR